MCAKFGTCTLPKSTEEVTYYDLVYSTTSLSYFSKILRKAYQSLTVRTVVECVAIGRITAAEMFQVYYAISSTTEYQQSDVEYVLLHIILCISCIRVCVFI